MLIELILKSGEWAEISPFKRLVLVGKARYLTGTRLIAESGRIIRMRKVEVFVAVDLALLVRAQTDPQSQTKRIREIVSAVRKERKGDGFFSSP